MRYELRTTFTINTGALVVRSAVDTTDKLLRWLYEFLPVTAALRSDLGRPTWSATRYNDPIVRLVMVTWYRNVFAATADRLRIDAAVTDLPSAVRAAIGTPGFDVLRVLGDAELVDWSDPTKIRITYP
jgi:hypothetical protein